MYRYLPDTTPHFTTDGQSTKIHACKWQVRALECIHCTAFFFQNSTALTSIADKFFSYKYNGNSLENQATKPWQRLNLQTLPLLLIFSIGHFRVTLCHCFKTSLCVKPFIWKCAPSREVHFQVNQTHFHMKGFARGLVWLVIC